MKPTIIIAEAGVNHNGSLDTALKLVAAAAKAGADYVKFQTFLADRLVSASAAKAEYQQRNCRDNDNSQLAMLRALELSEKDFAAIAAECRRMGIGFMSTPFDFDSIELLDGIGMDYWKIPSGEITDLPYLRRIGAKRGNVILSTGMSTLDEVKEAVAALEQAGTPRRNVWLLHCTTQYPTPYEDVNLRAMENLRTLGCAGVGYSDHTEGITVPVAAAALGAEIIEKHFTLDRNMPGPDHKASLEPHELEAMVASIRKCEAALGHGMKEVAESERPNIAVARRSIVASRHIAKGEILDEHNMTTKRPGTGISPMRWDAVAGTRAVRDFEADEEITI